MEVVLIQAAIDDRQDKRQRVERIAELLGSLQGADLILLPEVWNIGYGAFDDYEAEAEALDGFTISKLRPVARQLKAYLLAGSIVERRDGRLYNASVFLDRQGKTVAVYRKIHLFGYGSRENEILSPGNEVVVFDTDFGRVGLATCYDLRFPELFRRMVDQGAEFFLVTAAWPYPRIEHWYTLNRARAIENQCFVLACNSAGESRGMRFIGRSTVIDPWGWTVVSAGDREDVIRVRIRPEMVRMVRSDFRVLTDRRL